MNDLVKRTLLGTLAGLGIVSVTVIGGRNLKAQGQSTPTTTVQQSAGGNVQELQLDLLRNEAMIQNLQSDVLESSVRGQKLDDTLSNLVQSLTLQLAGQKNPAASTGAAPVQTTASAPSSQTVTASAQNSSPPAVQSVSRASSGKMDSMDATPGKASDMDNESMSGNQTSSGSVAGSVYHH